MWLLAAGMVQLLTLAAQADAQASARPQQAAGQAQQVAGQTQPRKADPKRAAARRAAGARDPYAHRVRVGLFPAHFLVGVTQSHFGSSARASVDLMRGLSLSARGRVRWPVTTGEQHGRATLLGGTVHIHLVDDERMAGAGGTVYPDDVPAAGNSDRVAAASGSDQDLPVNQRMGGPRLTLPEVDREAIVPMRSLHTLRVGYDYVQSVQKGEFPTAGTLPLENRIHLLRLGYSFGDHWNLGPQALGQRELGFKHVFMEVLVAVEATSEWRALGDLPTAGEKPGFMPLGLRLGVEGGIDALIDAWEGAGLAYLLEAGSLPGYRGLEGYLLLALGLELDG